VCGRREKPKSKGLWPRSRTTAQLFDRCLDWQIRGQSTRSLCNSLLVFVGRITTGPCSGSQFPPIGLTRTNSSFDAERAVAFYVQRGNIDEAAWLVFLMTHFASKQFLITHKPQPVSAAGKALELFGHWPSKGVAS
jgi:hypothetical protein